MPYLRASIPMYAAKSMLSRTLQSHRCRQLVGNILVLCVFSSVVVALYCRHYSWVFTDPSLNPIPVSAGSNLAYSGDHDELICTSACDAASLYSEWSVSRPR